MQIFISVDIEGVAGVHSLEHLGTRGGAQYERSRRWMTLEASAAAEAAFDAGASKVVVADFHANGDNMLPDEMHPEVILLQGRPRPFAAGLSPDFDACFLIGYHAQVGTPTAVIPHTVDGQWPDVRLNGRTIGESALSALLAGHFGVPVALVSGDDRLAAEMAKQIPWAERVVTKTAHSFFSAESLSPARSCEAIRAGVKRALARLPEMKPLIPQSSIRMEIDFALPLKPQLMSIVHGVERSGNTISFSGQNILEVLDVLELVLLATEPLPY